MITHLDPHPSAVEPPAFAGEDNPMRIITRSAAAGEWTEKSADDVAALFDQMAPEWSANRSDDRYEPIADAVERSHLRAAAKDLRVLELGSGTGLGTKIIRRFYDNVVAMDLSIEMLHHAPAELAPQVNTDASNLPLPDSSIDLIVMVNMILFPGELERVLTPEGSILWVNTLAEQTPIHLSAEDVDQALPGDWTGVASRHGTGTWSVHRRTSAA